MAYRTIPSLLLIFLVILTITGEAVAARNFRGRSSIDDDKKQPQWLVGYDGVSVLVPGIGRITLSPYDKGSHGGGHAGLYGSNPAPRRRYIPGGDDNFIPNPGFEVPIPANIDGVKEKSYP